MILAHCPVCKNTNLASIEPEFVGACVTSDMMVLPDTALANRFCNGCGLIFNAGGTRGQTEVFYRDSYKLMMRQDSAIVSFAGAKPISQAQRSLDTLLEFADLPKQGVVLEAGAGKGEFTELFADALPDWSVTAFESSAAVQELRRRLPNAQIDDCQYEQFDAASTPYDLIVTLGVLEHVENPAHMLRWAFNLLSEDGLFYLRVPNFELNPNDLFCADHLSKLTPATLHELAARCGFVVEHCRSIGVPVFALLRKVSAVDEQSSNAIEANRRLVRSNSDVAMNLMEAIDRGRAAAQAAGEAFAIFGLGSSGLFAPLLQRFPPEDIAAYIDENQSVWGGSVHGRPIGGLNLIDELSIRHVTLAISPVYTEQVSKKLKSHGVTVYSGA